MVDLHDVLPHSVNPYAAYSQLGYRCNLLSFSLITWYAICPFKDKFIFFPLPAWASTWHFVPVSLTLVNSCCIHYEQPFFPGFSALVNSFDIFCIQPTVLASTMHSSHCCHIPIFFWVHWHFTQSNHPGLDHSLPWHSDIFLHIQFTFLQTLTVPAIFCACQLTQFTFFEHGLFQLPLTYVNWFSIFFCSSTFPDIYFEAALPCFVCCICRRGWPRWTQECLLAKNMVTVVSWMVPRICLYKWFMSCIARLLMILGSI